MRLKLIVLFVLCGSGLTAGELESPGISDPDCGSALVVSQAYIVFEGQVVDIDENLNFTIRLQEEVNKDYDFTRTIRLAGIDFDQLSKLDRERARKLMVDWTKGRDVSVLFASDRFLIEQDIPPGLIKVSGGSVNYSILKRGFGSVNVKVPYEIDHWLACVFEKARNGSVQPHTRTKVD